MPTVTTSSDSVTDESLQSEENVRLPVGFRDEVLTESSSSPVSFDDGTDRSSQYLSNVKDMFDRSHPAGVFNQRINHSLDNHYSINSSSDTDSKGSNANIIMYVNI